MAATGSVGTGALAIGEGTPGAGNASEASSTTNTQLPADGGEKVRAPFVATVPPGVVLPLVGSNHHTFA